MPYVCQPTLDLFYKIHFQSEILEVHIDFDTNEGKIILDEKGHIKDIVKFSRKTFIGLFLLHLITTF